MILQSELVSQTKRKEHFRNPSVLAIYMNSEGIWLIFSLLLVVWGVLKNWGRFLQVVPVSIVCQSACPLSANSQSGVVAHREHRGQRLRQEDYYHDFKNILHKVAISGVQNKTKPAACFRGHALLPEYSWLSSALYLTQKPSSPVTPITLKTYLTDTLGEQGCNLDGRVLA